jgi:MFS family permease
MPTFLREFVSPTVANLAFSVYFLTYIPARVFHTLYADRIGSLRLLVVSGIGAAGLLTYACSVGTGLSVVLALSVAGFFVAGLFPLLSAYGIAAVPENSGPLNGLSLGASVAGGSLSPIVLGVLIDASSIQTAVNLFSGYAIALAIVVSVMLLHEQ